MELTTWNLPVLALRGLTVFPHMTLTFDVERPISIAALERAMEADQDIFLVTQREIGKMMGISRSYVSRIEKKALEKLRHRMADFGIMW